MTHMSVSLVLKKFRPSRCVGKAVAIVYNDNSGQVATWNYRERLGSSFSLISCALMTMVTQVVWGAVTSV
jgi:hypothetical protein